MGYDQEAQVCVCVSHHFCDFGQVSYILKNTVFSFTHRSTERIKKPYFLPMQSRFCLPHTFI